ncbi:hypothetical protein [Methanofollis sp.]|nr:hypothetical protein [Methanofollis sp.]
MCSRRLEMVFRLESESPGTCRWAVSCNEDDGEAAETWSLVIR